MSAYRRTFKGLIKRAKLNNSAIKYDKFKIGDQVKLVNDVLAIDQRIYGYTDGFMGEAYRRRERYRIILNYKLTGHVVESRFNDYFILFQSTDNRTLSKWALDKPLRLSKYQLVKIT